MHWLMAMVGALLGAGMGGAGSSVLGFVAGILIGWQGVRIAQLNRRVDEAETLIRGQGVVTTQLRAAAAAARAAASATTPPDGALTPPPGASVTPRDVAAAAALAAIRTPAVADASASIGVPTPPVAAPAIAVAAPIIPATMPASVTDASASVTSTPASNPRAATPARAPALSAAREAPSPVAMPRAPHEPGLGDRIVALVKGWLFTGNVPVKLGMLVLFFGVAAALKYVVDQGWISFPIEFRLAAIAALALAGLVWGWRNREVRPAFGLSLQGGAIGVLLLTVFAAYRLYALLPSAAAFVLVLLLVAGAAALAVLQNAVALAVLGFVGGYLAPVLISTGSGNHVALFTYYAILNAAVFAIAWLRPWRALNLIGFAFTFGIGTLWGAQYFRPELFPTVEPFLVLFFLFYVAIAVLYALRGDAARAPLVDGTLVFGTPLLAFPLQAAMLADDRYALAYSALAVAVLYAGLAWWLIRRRGVMLLGQSFGALALGFATLAVPLALSARWTCATWALEGAAIAWLGLRQQRLLPQFTGWALQGLAAVAYVVSVADGGFDAPPGEWLILNGPALSVLLMAGAALLLSFLYDRAHGHRLLVWLGFVVGMGWWTVAGLRELVEHVSLTQTSLGLVWFAALTALLSGALRGVLQWPRLGWNVLGVAVLGLPLAILSHVEADSALLQPALLPWLVWFAVMVFGLWRLRDPAQRGLSLAHVATLATAALLYGLGLQQLAARSLGLGDAWQFLSAIAPLLLLVVATWRAPALGAFPLADRFPRYAARWFVPAGIALALAWVVSLGHDGNAAPLPFVPLLNPIELFQLSGLLVGGHWLLRHSRSDAPLAPLVAVAGFIFITLAGLRAVHHFTGAPWTPEILDDRVAQATLTVLWSVLGVAAWIIGSRQRRWGVWLCGAILMGMVLLKLVLVDRQYFGNLSGIVSFLAVGALLVLVGRIAPTPPRAAADEGIDAGAAEERA